MFNTYKLRFTQDRKSYITRCVPAQNLAEAYLIIQDRYPNAEITEANEDESWAKVIAKHMIAHASLDEVCTFACGLEAQKHDEFINAIWDEWHKSKNSKVV